MVTVDVRRADLKGAAVRDFYLRAVEQIQTVPAVVSAGAISAPPLGGAAMDESLFVRGERVPAGGAVYALPGYFETVGIRLLRGRFFGPNDVSRGAAVVSETGTRVLSRQQQDPIGQFVELDAGVSVPVVGVVPDVVHSVGNDNRPDAYLMLGDSGRRMTIVARVRSRNPATLREIQRVVAALAPTSPVTVNWWRTNIDATPAFRIPRFQTLVLGSFALVSLLLTAVGIYGVVSFLTARRKREIGVRLAIGARPALLTRSFVSQMIVPLTLGIALGSLAMWWLAKIAAAQLRSVQPNDPGAAAIAMATVLASALLAAYLPARRASRLDPVATLREE